MCLKTIESGTGGAAMSRTESAVEEVSWGGTVGRYHGEGGGRKSDNMMNAERLKK